MTNDATRPRATAPKAPRKSASSNAASASAARKKSPKKAVPAAKRKAATPKPDLQRADWIHAGMQILARSGVDAVLIPPLANMLGVTKGSFYWHFSSREELLQAMIDAWKRHATLRVIEIVESAGATAQEKIRHIAFIGTNAPIDEFGGAIELAVRAWARSNGDVREAIAEVDRQRLEYLTRLYAEIGSPVDPELLACLHYSFSTGLRLIFAYPEKQKLAMRQAALDQIFFATGTP